MSKNFPVRWNSSTFYLGFSTFCLRRWTSPQRRRYMVDIYKLWWGPKSEKVKRGKSEEFFHLFHLLPDVKMTKRMANIRY